MSMNVPEKLSYGKYLARSACNSVKIMCSCKSDWKKTKNGNLLFVWKKLFVFLKGKHDEFSIFREKKLFSVVQISVVYFFSVSSLNTGHAETVYHNSARVYFKLTRKLLTIRV